MEMENVDLGGITIGFALSGSFCSINNIFTEIEQLIKYGANIIPIISNIVGEIDTRFNSSDKTKEALLNITSNNIIETIKDAEPIGPKSILDALVIAPATGNTIAKIANAITDTTVTMACKAQLRNNKPVIIAISTNDGLGVNAKNIGTLLNYKNIYFTPFFQDDPINKSNSLTARKDLIIPSIIEALNGKQIQPLLCAAK